MACFLVPATEAVITTITAKILKHRECKAPAAEKDGETLSHKLGTLNNMLWGGSALLALEHVWHGEVEPFFPFLTAASDPTATAEMLNEMATSGTAMAAVVTGVWAAMMYAKSALAKNTPARDTEQTKAVSA